MLLRPGRPEDADALARIRKEPEVVRRWGAAGIEEEIREAFVGHDEGFVIEADGEVVGAIQYGEEEDPMNRSRRHGLPRSAGVTSRKRRPAASSTKSGPARGSRSARPMTTEAAMPAAALKACRPIVVKGLKTPWAMLKEK